MLIKGPTRCNSMQTFIYCRVTLHVSGVTAPIIRSTKNCISYLWCKSWYCYCYFLPPWPPPPPPPPPQQSAMGFGLSNNTSPFFPIFPYLSPTLSIFSPPALEDLFPLLPPSFPGSSFSSLPFQCLSEDLFGHPILLHFLQVTQPTYPLPLYPFYYIFSFIQLSSSRFALIFHYPSSYLGPYCSYTYNSKNLWSRFRPYIKCLYMSHGPGSSVGIATDYGLDGPGIKSWLGRDFPPVQTGPGAHPASCTMGTGSLPRVKCGRGVLLTTHPLLALRSQKSRAIPLPHSGPQLGL